MDFTIYISDLCIEVVSSVWVHTCWRLALNSLTFIKQEALVEVYLQRTLTSALSTSPFSIPYKVDIS